MALQYYKHQVTGEVYGASEKTRPPASFYESRVGDNGKPEFVKVAAPKVTPQADRKGAKEGQAKDPAPNDDGGQGDGGDKKGGNA